MKTLLLLVLLCCLPLSAAGAKPSGQILSLPGMQGLGRVEHLVIETRDPARRLQLLLRAPTTRPVEPIPVLYILDGGLLFPLFSSYYHLLHIAEELPAILLVGISYGTDNWQEGNFRSTDFTLPSPERDFWGGAPAFARLLEKEIFPAVEKRFKVDPNRRFVFGQSLGGQFVLYAAQYRPGLFSGHIASNPALHRNLEAFLEPATCTSGRLFVSLADGDDLRFREPAETWLSHWEKHPNRKFEVKVLQQKGHTHLSPSPEAFRLGLQWLLSN